MFYNEKDGLIENNASLSKPNEDGLNKNDAGQVQA